MKKNLTKLVSVFATSLIAVLMAVGQQILQSHGICPVPPASPEVAGLLGFTIKGVHEIIKSVA